MRVAITASCVVALAMCACEASTRSLPPSASAAREFRPVGDVQLLPDRAAPVEVREVGLVPDSKVEWKVRTALSEAGLDVSGLELTVRDQVVTLRGVVPAGQAEKVAQVVGSTSSVAGVRNQLEVRP